MRKIEDCHDAVQAKLEGLQEELSKAQQAEQAALRHWDVERDAVKATLQQLEDVQTHSKQQNVGLAQAHAQAAVGSQTPCTHDSAVFSSGMDKKQGALSSMEKAHGM